MADQVTMQAGKAREAGAPGTKKFQVSSDVAFARGKRLGGKAGRTTRRLASAPASSGAGAGAGRTVSFVSMGNVSLGGPDFGGGGVYPGGSGFEVAVPGYPGFPGGPVAPLDSFTVVNGVSQELAVSDDDNRFDQRSPFQTGAPQDTGAPQVLARDITIDGRTYVAGEAVYTTGPVTLVDAATGTEYVAVGIGIGEQDIFDLRGGANLVGYAFVGERPPPGVALSLAPEQGAIFDASVNYADLSGPYPPPEYYYTADVEVAGTTLRGEAYAPTAEEALTEIIETRVEIIASLSTLNGARVTYEVTDNGDGSFFVQVFTPDAPFPDWPVHEFTVRNVQSADGPPLEFSQTGYTATVTDDSGATVLTLDTDPGTAAGAAQQVAGQILGTRYEPEGTITANDYFIEYRRDAEIQSVTDNGDGTYTVTITQQFGREYRNAGGAQSYTTTDTYTIGLEARSAGTDAPPSAIERDLEDIDIDGSSDPDDVFDFTAERTFNLAGRVLAATGGDKPSDWTDVEYTALTFTLTGHEELVGGDAWDAFVAANFEDGRYLGGTPDLSMFEGLTTESQDTLIIATLDAAIVSEGMNAVPENAEFTADAWETAFQETLDQTTGQRRRLAGEMLGAAGALRGPITYNGFYASISGGGAAEGGAAAGVAATGTTGLAAALGGAGLVIGAELLIAYVAVQSFRSIQHESRIPVYGTRPTAEMQEELQDKYLMARLAVPAQNSRSDEWVADQATAVETLVSDGDIDGAIALLREIEATEGAHTTALVFTALDPAAAGQVSTAIVDDAMRNGRFHPSGNYINVVVDSGEYSALEDLAFGVDARGHSIGEGAARTDGAITAANVGRINSGAGPEAIADILSVLSVQELAAPGTSNINTFLAVTIRNSSGGIDIINDAVKVMAGRRDGSAEALVEVLMGLDDDNLKIPDIFRDANTEATSEYYATMHGEDGSATVPQGFDGVNLAFEALTTPQERAAFLLELPPEDQARLIDTLSVEDADATLLAIASSPGGTDSLIQLLNTADEDFAAGVLISLAVNDPEATADLLKQAAADPVANANMLEAAASVSPAVLGIIDPTDFVAVIDILASTGQPGADLAAKMLNGFDNDEIAAVLTLMENPEARDAILSSSARRANFTRADEIDAELGIIPDETREVAAYLTGQVESGALTMEEAGQLFYLYDMGLYMPNEQGARDLSGASGSNSTDQAGLELFQNITNGTVPEALQNATLTDEDQEAIETASDDIFQTANNTIAENTTEIDDFINTAAPGETLETDSYVIIKTDTDLVQIQFRVRADTDHGNGRHSGYATYGWFQFNAADWDQVKSMGEFDYSIVVRPHYYTQRNVEAPRFGLNETTGFVELGFDLEISRSRQRNAAGEIQDRWDRTKFGLYALPGVTTSNLLRYVPSNIFRGMVGALANNLPIGQENVERYSEHLTNLGMLGLGIAAGANRNDWAQPVVNMLIGEGVRGLLGSTLPALATAVDNTPGAVAALGEALVAGFNWVYNKFNPGNPQEISVSEDDILSIAAGGPADDIPVRVVPSDGAVEVIVDGDGDIEMMPMTPEVQARSLLAGRTNERQEVVSTHVPDQPVVDALPAPGDEGDDLSEFESADSQEFHSTEGFDGDAAGQGAVSNSGSYWSAATDYISSHFASRTVQIGYISFAAHWVNNDIVPGQEPDDFRGGWNGDGPIPDYFSVSFAYVTVSEGEFTWNQPWESEWFGQLEVQTGVPRFDYVTLNPIWSFMNPITDEGGLVLEQDKQNAEEGEDENAQSTETQQPTETP